MSLRVNNNIAALNAYRNLSVTDGQMSKSLEKLSSGFRINRAADDAAGLAISEGLRSQIGGLKVAVRNTQDGDLQATDLRTQALGDGEAGGVVGGTVDAEAGGELLQRLGHLVVGDGQVAVRVHRRDVVVDAETHGGFLLGRGR